MGTATTACVQTLLNERPVSHVNNATPKTLCVPMKQALRAALQHKGESSKISRLAHSRLILRSRLI